MVAFEVEDEDQEAAAADDYYQGGIDDDDDYKQNRVNVDDIFEDEDNDEAETRRV